MDRKKTENQRIHILCVDDDAGFLDLTRAWLSQVEGFSVHTETDPREALDRLHEETTSVDAVVSDYQMPDIDGLAFLKRVRDSFENLPFILFTGEGSESIASRAIAAGVTDYLQKHGEDRYKLLENRIKNAVEANRARKEVERERQLREWILASIPVGIVGHNRDGDVLFLNDSATEILAASTDELDGRAYRNAGWTLLSEDGTPIEDEELPYRRVVDLEENLEAERYLLRTSDGRERPLVVYGSPMWDNAGSVNGAVIAFYYDD